LSGTDAQRHEVMRQIALTAPKEFKLDPLKPSHAQVVDALKRYVEANLHHLLNWAVAQLTSLNHFWISRDSRRCTVADSFREPYRREHGIQKNQRHQRQEQNDREVEKHLHAGRFDEAQDAPIYVNRPHGQRGSWRSSIA
jgi:hypothetical protein